jgi:hypothetical protein
MRIREDGKVCMPPMWWIFGSVVYLRAIQLLPLVAPIMWFLERWTTKEAIIGFVAAIALQWVAMIPLKLLEEAFFVRDVRKILGEDDYNEKE